MCISIVLPLSILLTHHLFFNDTATTEIYTLSLHDALPISAGSAKVSTTAPLSLMITSLGVPFVTHRPCQNEIDRKSTRLNSSHLGISYAVFCLKKKKKKTRIDNHVKYLHILTSYL